MKNMIVIAALALAGTPALASKARVSALNNSRQLVDVQYTFERPFLMGTVGELATIEWGTQGTGSVSAGAYSAVSPHAEGGFIKKQGESFYGLYFGRKSDDVTTAVTNANTALHAFTFLDEQNPLNLMYSMKSGDITWGATLKYSNGKNDSLGQTASSSGVVLSATNGKWDVELVQGLAAKTANGTKYIESKANSKVVVGYNLSDAHHAYLDYKTAKVDSDVTGSGTVTTTEVTTAHLGFINTLVKNDEANFFYGAAFGYVSTKDTSDVMTLPLWIGVEANATSWMVFRGSVTQNVLLNSTKSTASGATNGQVTDVDSIVAAAGVGIKLNKGMLDASLAGTGAGTVNGNSLLSNVSYTYNF